MTPKELANVKTRLELARYYAERSSIKSFMTGAVIFDRQGNLLSSGWSHYSSLLRLKKFRSIHAELHAILRAPRDKLDGSTIFVATIRRKSRNTGMARPCEGCLTILNEVEISNAYYTVEGTEWGYFEVNLEYERVGV